MSDENVMDLRDRTRAFALCIMRVYASLGKDNLSQVLGKQVLRSGTSVGAHYREATRARSDAEFISKLEVGLQELDESAYWLELLAEGEVVARQRLEKLLQEVEELTAILVTCAKNAKHRHK